MPSKRCATSAKRSGNCSSALVTNRMACQSRCEIRVQASRRRLSSACSRPSTPRNRAVWGWACRSAVRSSTRTAADCGRARTCPAAPAFNSPCRRSQTLRRDAALVSRPKEQATRPRVLLWVKRRNTRREQMFSALLPEADVAPFGRQVRFVPILLQKSAYRRRGTAGAFFEAIDCHPLDCAGDLRSTLLTLATLTQRTKGRTVVAGRPTWQAYGGSAQSLPT